MTAYLQTLADDALTASDYHTGEALDHGPTNSRLYEQEVLPEHYNWVDDHVGAWVASDPMTTDKWLQVVGFD